MKHSTHWRARLGPAQSGHEPGEKVTSLLTGLALAIWGITRGSGMPVIGSSGGGDQLFARGKNQVRACLVVSTVESLGRPAPTQIGGMRWVASCSLSLR